MGLLDFFRRAKPAPKEATILILGLDNAGKTCILKKLCDEEITHVQSTQGFNIRSVASSDNSFKLNALDIGGQKSIRAYWRHYFEKAEAVVFVIDSADRKRMEETQSEFEQLLEEPKLANVPILVFANKQDLVTASTPASIAEVMHLETIRDRPWQIAACSAKTGAGLQEGMEWLTKSLK